MATTNLLTDELLYCRCLVFLCRPFWSLISVTIIDEKTLNNKNYNKLQKIFVARNKYGDNKPQNECAEWYSKHLHVVPAMCAAVI